MATSEDLSSNDLQHNSSPERPQPSVLSRRQMLRRSGVVGLSLPALGGMFRTGPNAAGAGASSDVLATTSTLVGNRHSLPLITTTTSPFAPLLKDLAPGSIDSGSGYFRSAQTSTPQHDPSVSHPENFYTYRHTLISNDVLDALEGEFAGFPDSPLVIDYGYLFLNVWRSWNDGNIYMNRGLIARAIGSYTSCLQAIVSFFIKDEGEDEDDARVRAPSLAGHYLRLKYRFTPDAETFAYRREQSDLHSLFQADWVQLRSPGYWKPSSWNTTAPTPGLRWMQTVETPMLALGLVFVPLAVTEAFRWQGHFDEALAWCNEILDTNDAFRTLAEGIELPFVTLLRAQILSGRADDLYKRGARDEAEAAYGMVLDQLSRSGQDVDLVTSGLATLNSLLPTLLPERTSPLSEAETSDGAPTSEVWRGLQTTAMNVPFENIGSKSDFLPGLDPTVAPLEGYLDFRDKAADSNPVILALMADALARIRQIQSGLNYLGYSDDFIPPWRFRFLLDRARYFTENAKAAQSQYLAFLASAEREEFEERTAAKTVILEKANIRVETARVEQSTLEVKSAWQSQQLADLVADNAERRVENYQWFDEFAEEEAERALEGQMLEFIGTTQRNIFNPTTWLGLGGSFNEMMGQREQLLAQLWTAEAQREIEKKNLALTRSEALQASQVAAAQLDVSLAGLEVAIVQRAVALLRHEVAVQNLAFLRQRSLNAEMWFRLAHLIRGVGDTYMRYAVELAFLTEQAYEYESDRRINTIRFEYGGDEATALLAGDFLLTDLDTLEQDQLVGQRERQQHVRYVLSLARDFPQALMQLRESGSAIFTLSLEHLERRFPGLYNVRIGSVEVMPVALMDSTRFSLELTYLGTSQVRHTATPDTVPGSERVSSRNQSEAMVDSWMPALDIGWPVTIRVVGPETAVYTGLSRPERDSVFQFVASNQLNAFEHLGAASSWRVDMSMHENRVVPGTLADVLVTFDLTGYHDSRLRAERERQPVRPGAVTTWISAQQVAPDALYELNRTGTMTWPVTLNPTSLSPAVGALRNFAIVLVPAPRTTHFGRIQCRYTVEYKVTEQLQLEVLTPIPQISFKHQQLTITAKAEILQGPMGDIFWDFGAGNGFQEGKDLTFSYQSPGRYIVGLRIVSGSRLFDYRAAIVVSSIHEVRTPLTVAPSLSIAGWGGPFGTWSNKRVHASMVSDVNSESVSAHWQMADASTNVQWSGEQSTSSALTAQYNLAPGHYRLAFTATRDLTGHIYSDQRFLPKQSLTIQKLHVATNRRFGPDGKLSADTTEPNALSSHLFDGGPLSPIDRWTLDLSLTDNPFLRTVGADDKESIDLSEIHDAVLGLEFEGQAT